MTNTNEQERERRTIPSLRIIKSPRKVGFETNRFWYGDLRWYSTPWITLVVDFRKDFQVMSDMIGKPKKRQDQ